MNLGRKIAVPADVRAATNLDRIDYSDAYAGPPTSAPTAEAWMRRTFDNAPAVERGAIKAIWLACGAVFADEPGNLFGCPLDALGPDLARMTVRWRSGVRANVFAYRTDDHAIVSTLVRFDHRGARALWLVIGPLHRLASRIMAA